MVCNKISKIVIAFLLVFMVTVVPALAEVSNSDFNEYYSDINSASSGSGNIIPVNEDTHNDVTSTPQAAQTQENTPEKKSDSKKISAMDKANSEDYILGFPITKNHDITEDFSGQDAVDTAHALPIYGWAVRIIQLLCVGVIFEIIGVSLWNQHKVSKSARDENPNKAAEGIKAAEKNQKAFMSATGYCGVFLAVVVFLVTTFAV